jgi:outer membrane immunogenic protein
VWQNWSAKLEYNYMDFGKRSFAFPAVEFNSIFIDQQMHVVKLGISYSFH